MRGIEIFHCAFADPALNLYLPKLYRLWLRPINTSHCLLNELVNNIIIKDWGRVVLRESSPVQPPGHQDSLV
jgi:hypothetical protein